MKDDTISYLVLDYNKPLETKRALESLHAHSKFNHQIIYLSNGGDQSYTWSLYRDGLIDRFICNKVNNGLGYGTEDLFRFCDTEWSIYFQNDQELVYDISQNQITSFISKIKDNPKIGAIGFAGYPCGQNIYSERAHLINTQFYNSIPKTHGGCGPFNHLKYNEQCVQEFFKDNGYQFLTLSTSIVRDLGFYTIRELPCGGVVRMRTDTKSVRWLKLPKEPYMFPEMNDNEWQTTIAGQWIDGTIPSSYLIKNETFNCWGDIES